MRSPVWHLNIPIYSISYRAITASIYPQRGYRTGALKILIPAYQKNREILRRKHSLKNVIKILQSFSHFIWKLPIPQQHTSHILKSNIDQPDPVIRLGLMIGEL